MAEYRGDLTAARRLSANLAVNVPDWQAGKQYLKNDLFLHNGQLYFVTTPHVSTVSPQADIANLNQSNSSLEVETLLVVSPNNINPLSQLPLSPVQFFVNGNMVDGITNSGSAVTVDNVTLGFNVQTSDVVKAVYAY